MDKKIHTAPYAGTNNRKHTICRLTNLLRVQNVPMFDKPKEAKGRKFIGYRYIFH